MSNDKQESQSLNPFGGGEVQTLEMPSTAMATSESQRAMAETQSAMVIAKKFPRDPKVAMDKILNECTRVGLAEKATYQFNRGGTDIFGPSIRLAETISRQWGNFQAGLIELTRNQGVSEVMAYACDLETNRWERIVFHVKHWRDTRSGGYELTDERDIYELIANQGARRKRSCILALIPGDVTEGAVKQCDMTLKTKVQITPETIKSMIDKFDSYGVTKELIEKRIQRRVDSMTPGQMINLGKIYTSLEDGMSVASDWFEMEEKPTSLNGDNDVEPPKKTTKGRGKKKEEKEKEPETQTPGVTAIDVINSIKKAKDLEVLAIAGDLIRELPDDDRSAVQAEYDKKEKELTPE